jgi:hypothetical protein
VTSVTTRVDDAPVTLPVLLTAVVFLVAARIVLTGLWRAVPPGSVTVTAPHATRRPTL